MAKKKINIASNITFIILGIILTLYTLSILVPAAWGLMTSFKSANDFEMTNTLAFPKKLFFGNYSKALENFRIEIPDGAGSRSVYIDEMFLNSILYSFGMAAVATIVPCISAYLCAKFNYKFSRFLFSLVVIIMIIPVVGNMPSMIMVLKTLYVYDTYIGLILMKASIGGTYFIIFYSTFKGLSNGYAEAAKIDGASNTCIMFRIMFPLVKTTIGAVYLLTLISLWNDYMTPLMYYPSHPTAALGLMRYNLGGGRISTSIPAKLTGAFIVSVPILIVFMLFKKHLMGNLTMGGLKG